VNRCYACKKKVPTRKVGEYIFKGEMFEIRLCQDCRGAFKTPRKEERENDS